MSNTTGAGDVRSMIDGARLSSLQKRIVVLCTVCLMMDGFNVQSIGYVAPSIIESWAIAPAAFASVFAAGLFGMLVGSFAMSALADRIGRRPTLLICGVGTTLTLLAILPVASVGPLVALRFLNGVALGGFMPIAMALVNEYSPARIRVGTMMVAANGFSIGAVLAGFVAVVVVHRFGWQANFLVGGVLALALTVAMWRLLPESLHFLVDHGSGRERGLDRARAILARIVPDQPVDGALVYCASESRDLAARQGEGAVALFGPRYLRSTLCLWTICFVNLLTIYCLSNWIPVVMRAAQYGRSEAVLVGTAFQIGGVAGTFLLGTMIDRFGFRRMLGINFLCIVASVASIGLSIHAEAVLFLAATLAGVFVFSSQAATNALAGSLYPSHLRSTGIGWSLGFGRIGSVVGPVIGGALVARDWAPAGLFLAAALPSLLSFAAILCARPQARTLPARLA